MWWDKRREKVYAAEDADIETGIETMEGPDHGHHAPADVEQDAHLGNGEGTNRKGATTACLVQQCLLG